MTTNTQTRAAIAAQNEAQLLRSQLEHATVKLATAQAENRRLRRMTTNGRMGRILHRTAADARQIVGWRFANYSVSRRNCESYGMSQQRWAWAVAMLRAAGVVPYPGDTDAFTVEDLDAALAMIDQEVKRIESRGDLSRLALRMYRRRR
jgi:hypothetical protein